MNLAVHECRLLGLSPILPPPSLLWRLIGTALRVCTTAVCLAVKPGAFAAPLLQHSSWTHHKAHTPPVSVEVRTRSPSRGVCIPFIFFVDAFPPLQQPARRTSACVHARFLFSWDNLGSTRRPRAWAVPWAVSSRMRTATSTGAATRTSRLSTPRTRSPVRAAVTRGSPPCTRGAPPYTRDTAAKGAFFVIFVFSPAAAAAASVVGAGGEGGADDAGASVDAVFVLNAPRPFLLLRLLLLLYVFFSKT